MLAAILRSNTSSSSWFSIIASNFAKTLTWKPYHIRKNKQQQVHFNCKSLGTACMSNSWSSDCWFSCTQVGKLEEHTHTHARTHNVILTTHSSMLSSPKIKYTGGENRALTNMSQYGGTSTILAMLIMDN
jgi:hypothetical protein